MFGSKSKGWILPGGIKIENVGCIKSLELPKGWARDSSPLESGGREVIRFHPTGSAQIAVCTFVRQLPLLREAAEAFLVTLNSDFHPLFQDELDLLEDVLEDMADPMAFQITEAFTGTIEDKRVLRIQGRWLKSLEDTLCYVVDVHGDGKIVQQLYYIAPADLFNDHKASADEVFQSVKWQHTGDKPAHK